jgi:hypothetical protein
LENNGTYFWCNHSNTIVKFVVLNATQTLLVELLFIKLSSSLKFVIFNQTIRHTHNSQTMNPT